MTDKFKSGFVVIVGKPNVGKSTLLNLFLNQKLAIVSNKPETTRDSILGILTTANRQAIFVDTPGIHKPHLLLGKMMVNKASNSLLGADLVIFLIEMTSGLTDVDRIILEKIKDAKKPVIVALNKIDIAKKYKLLPVIDELRGEYPFSDFIPICALSGDNVQVLRDRIFDLLPVGKKYYPDQQVTDKSDLFQAAEIIREKVLMLTREEVPHSVAVIIEKFSKREEKEILDIDATIYVERESQKAILVGQKGSMSKEIGSLSRVELEEKFKIKVFMQLWVKVLKNWRKSEISLKKLGIE